MRHSDTVIFIQWQKLALDKESIRVEKIGYACSAEDETLDTAWGSVKGHYGL